MRESQFEPTHRTIKSHDGIELVLYGWPWPNYPVANVMLLHGLGEHCGRYCAVAKRLCQAGFAVYGFDMRGHGLSGGRRGDAQSFLTLADDVEFIFDVLSPVSPLRPWLVLGHSLGGTLTLYFATRNKKLADAYVVLSPFLLPSKHLPLWKTISAKYLRWLIPTLSVNNGVASSFLSRDKMEVDLYISDPLVHDRISVRLGASVQEWGARIFQQATRLGAPVFMLQGASDQITPHETAVRFSGRLSGQLIFVIWPHAYHELLHDYEKNEVMERIASWMVLTVNKLTPMS